MLPFLFLTNKILVTGIVVAQQVKLLAVMLAFHVDMGSSPLCSIFSPANASRKAVKDGPNTWVTASYVRDLDGVSGT